MLITTEKAFIWYFLRSYISFFGVPEMRDKVCLRACFTPIPGKSAGYQEHGTSSWIVKPKKNQSLLLIY